MIGGDGFFQFLYFVFLYGLVFFEIRFHHLEITCSLVAIGPDAIVLPVHFCICHTLSSHSCIVHPIRYYYSNDGETYHTYNQEAVIVGLCRLVLRCLLGFVVVVQCLCLVDCFRRPYYCRRVVHPAEQSRVFYYRICPELVLIVCHKLAVCHFGTLYVVLELYQFFQIHVCGVCLSYGVVISCLCPIVRFLSSLYVPVCIKKSGITLIIVHARLSLVIFLPVKIYIYHSRKMACRKILAAEPLVHPYHVVGYADDRVHFVHIEIGVCFQGISVKCHYRIFGFHGGCISVLPLFKFIFRRAHFVEQCSHLSVYPAECMPVAITGCGVGQRYCLVVLIKRHGRVIKVAVYTSQQIVCRHPLAAVSVAVVPLGHGCHCGICGERYEHLVLCLCLQQLQAHAQCLGQAVGRCTYRRQHRKSRIGTAFHQ